MLLQMQFKPQCCIKPAICVSFIISTSHTLCCSFKRDGRLFWHADRMIFFQLEQIFSVGWSILLYLPLSGRSSNITEHVDMNNKEYSFV